MDTMTLLCNLQAEGPITLRRLREHGLGSIEELRRAPIQRLAQVLEADETAARRFLREAEILAQRCGDALEREEPAAITRPEAIAAGARAIPARAAEARPGSILNPVPASEIAGHAPARSSIATPPIASPPITQAPIAQAPIAQAPITQAPIAQAPIPAPMTSRPPVARTSSRAGIQLAVGILEGLDASICRDLASVGVHTLEELWRASALELARQLGWSFTALVDLQCEARQVIVERGSEAAPTPSGHATRLDWSYTVIPATSSPSEPATQGESETPAHRGAEPSHWTPAETTPGAGGPFS